ncbi:hypothetical protein SDRG_15430 [Saprolegnia diclina VS20]|uniref:Uncharacterized protein n=1 Tax=Saprolegnia diclina (strain VS20) TaxID=1156394 RepID=T0Q084_SAPDV|nr:hypothetical protein SDRG_15430 [Saprolegnia diclina VS20]EQC26780.1 hypothetical protein SDRG_15430 [Saprolegnia diclina VS20]|eukprot:XP_008619823.1 hypothetical protein SDRG_15430 [Saprolegnia diclina VS20]
MAAKRACHAPSDALALDHVRVGVIHCLGSLLDAVAFLRAMPSLDGPLAALLELLTTSSTVMKQWPVIVFDLVGAEDMDLALAALPALPAIHVSLCETLQGALAGRYDSLSAFTAAWPTKITHLDQCVNRDCCGFCP